jgi:mannose-6-phosphate isomerase-like protein (cupin superfamily)
VTDTLPLGKHQHVRVISSTADLLELQSTWSPGGDPPRAHYHPAQDERFDVLEGELMVDLAGTQRVLGPGEQIAVPRRTVHQMWNAGSEPARATWQVTPALQTEEMFRAIDAAPSPIQMVRLLWTYRREFRLPLRRPR